jgi:hypothetical protein
MENSMFEPDDRAQMGRVPGRGFPSDRDAIPNGATETRADLRAALVETEELDEVHERVLDLLEAAREEAQRRAAERDAEGPLRRRLRAALRRVRRAASDP